MKSIVSILTVLVAVSAALVSGAGAAEKVRVVTTIPDLKSLAQAVGGEHVDVESLTRGTQNFHEAEVRPSMMVKLRKADLLIENGADLDSWIDLAVQGANNANIARGGPGRVEISRGVPLLDVPTTRVDRSMGDVHPGGNPHFSLDPGVAPVITQNILDALARLAPQHRTVFESNRAAFLAKLDEHMARWLKLMEPHRGAKVVVYHPSFIYFITRFGLRQIGMVEDRPGIPPSPQHVVNLVRQMKDERVKVILIEPWSDAKLAARIAGDAGAKVIVMAGSVGAVKGADDYISAIDHNISALTRELR